MRFHIPLVNLTLLLTLTTHPQRSTPRSTVTKALTLQCYNITLPQAPPAGDEKHKHRPSTKTTPDNLCTRRCTECYFNAAGPLALTELPISGLSVRCGMLPGCDGRGSSSELSRYWERAGLKGPDWLDECICTLGQNTITRSKLECGKGCESDADCGDKVLQSRGCTKCKRVGSSVASEGKLGAKRKRDDAGKDMRVAHKFIHLVADLDGKGDGHATRDASSTSRYYIHVHPFSQPLSTDSTDGNDKHTSWEMNHKDYPDVVQYENRDTFSFSLTFPFSPGEYTASAHGETRVDHEVEQEARAKAKAKARAEGNLFSALHTTSPPQPPRLPLYETASTTTTAGSTTTPINVPTTADPPRALALHGERSDNVHEHLHLKRKDEHEDGNRAKGPKAYTGPEPWGRCFWPED